MKDTLEELGIARVAVIGAGTMGSGIAAQFANGGAVVDLLDIADHEKDRNARAKAGVARQIEAGGFMGSEAPARVRPGNLEDDFDRLAEADWIVEVVVEDLGIKRDLFRRIEAVRKPGSLVSSNTSTLARADLVAGMGDAFDRDFVITHFFNPPRVMLPVEIVSGAGSDPDQIARAVRSVEEILGKVVVLCRDTPGFIANRIGCTWIAIGIREAVDMGLTVEEADAAMAAMGVPKTGVFGLMDLIGLDLVPLVWSSLMAALPESDAINRHDLPGVAAIRALNARGHHGRKSGAGFYRKAPDGSREALDLETLHYRPGMLVDIKALPGGGRDLTALLESDGSIGRYAWRVFSELVLYAATHAPEIAGDVRAIDDAVSLGYGWRAGPFEMADRYGAARIVQRLMSEGRTVPLVLDAARQAGFYEDGVPLACDGKRASADAHPAPFRVADCKSRGPVLGNEAASLWDMGDGLHCLEIHTKMNSFSPAVFDVLEGALDRAGGRLSGLLLGNDDPRAFSAGADLGFFLKQIQDGDFGRIAAYLERGGRAMLAMKHAPVPVVAALRGFALGGGCEFSMHADVVVAHAEARLGLPEIKVGIIPGWGGCTQLRLRAQSNGATPEGAAERAFSTVFTGARSGSAAEARELGLLRGGDPIVMHPGHVLSMARDLAATRMQSYSPSEPPVIIAAGQAAAADLLGGLPDTATDTDRDLATRLAWVLTGGDAAAGTPLSEEEMMTLEREVVLDLSKSRASQDRVAHMMTTGKPLAN
jgi:3-hydroxyacyl-CoA dehydrogenase